MRALVLRALEQAQALQAPARVRQVPEQVQALPVPGLAQAPPVQAPVQRALAPGPECWRLAVRQALAFHRFCQKYSKRQ